MKANVSVAVLVPCYNESLTIANVIQQFRSALPDSTVYVYDNNSTDNTIEVASSNGAVVRRELLQGKGSVVRRMFSDIEADVYVMVDGDDTYDALEAPRMIDTLLHDNLAMVVGRRIHEDAGAYRPGHVLGNRVFSMVVESLFGRTFTDILSGYRVFSRAFVKSFPASALGFEIETELTVHSLMLRVPAREIDTIYRARPEGSSSKLNTYRDGVRILRLIIRLFKNERPLLFFSILGSLLVLLAAVLAYPLVVTFIETGYVPRFPTAILVTGLTLAGLISFVCGLILDAVTLGRKEAKTLAYLAATNAFSASRRTEAGRPVGVNQC